MVYRVTANAVVPEKSYIIEIGTEAVGADMTHHFEKLALVIRLSYALVTSSVVALQAVPVPVAVPPSVRSPTPQTFAMPPPPHVCGEVHVPHDETVRVAPQLSAPVTAPQLLPRREQKLVSLSDVQAPSNIWISASCVVDVLPLFAVMRSRYCWYAVVLVKVYE